MAKKKTFDTGRIQNLLNILSSGGNLGKEGLSYLRSYYESDEQFRQWYDENYGGMAKNSSGATVRLSGGKVQDAKDAYNAYGFTPLQNAKRAGAGTNEMLLRSGKRTNQTGAWQDAKIYTNGKSQVAGGRLKTSGETVSIIKRGLAGAKLSQEDQRIFDRWKTIQRETEENRSLSEKMYAQNAALSARTKAERAAKFQQLGMKDDGTLNDAQIQELLDKRAAKIKSDQEYADWERKQQYQEKQAAIEAQAKAQAEADKAALARRQKETDNGRTPDMTDEDYAKWMQLGGVKFAKWGYSAEDEAEIENARRDIRERMLSGELNATEGAEAQRQINEGIANGRWKKQVTLRDNMPEGQPVISDDGQFYVSDGKWTPLTQRESAEDKRKNALQDRKDKWIDVRAEKYLKETVKDEDLNEHQKYDYEQALALAQKDAATRFGADEEDVGADPNLFEDGNGDVCSLCGSPLDGEGVCTNPDCDHYREHYGDQPVAVEEPPEPVAGGHVKSSYL